MLIYSDDMLETVMGARHCKLFLTVSEKIFVVVWGAEVCAQVYPELFSLS